MRGQLKLRRVGHTGTLDPGASGVLPLVVGKATRLSDLIMEYDKTYVAELTLGISTSTQDGGGETVELKTDFSLSPWKLGEALMSFQGLVEQIPPMASAVKFKGQRLYELERRGVSVDRQPRQVFIEKLKIERIWSEEETSLGFGTRILLSIVCSKGTYIRTLCHDLGLLLDIPAHLSFLTRTASGPFTSGLAFTLEEIENLVRLGDFRFLLPMEAGLPHLIQVVIGPEAEKRVRHGNFILGEHFLDPPAALEPGERIVLKSSAGEMLALGEIKREGGLICQPFRVFAGE